MSLPLEPPSHLPVHATPLGCHRTLGSIWILNFQTLWQESMCRFRHTKCRLCSLPFSYLSGLLSSVFCFAGQCTQGPSEMGVLATCNPACWAQMCLRDLGFCQLDCVQCPASSPSDLLQGIAHRQGSDFHHSCQIHPTFSVSSLVA